MKILVCNVGSTSLKFKLYEMPEKKVYATAKVERVGSETEAIYSFCNTATGEKIEKNRLCVPKYKDGIALFLDDLLNPRQGILKAISEIEAVGFKTVLAKGHHGVFELDDAVLGAMRDYLFIAPAHNQPYLDAIGEFKAMLPGALLVGSFETAFHKTIPPERKLYALPYDWYEKYGIQRFGFHGHSHEYTARHLPELTGKDKFRFYAELGGLDYLTFAGGIGENSITVRRRVCDALGVFGVHIDPEKNSAVHGECELSAPDSKVKIYTIATDEEQMVAMKTYEYSLSH